MEFKHIEGKGKPIKVVAPEGCESFFFTEGNEYKVHEAMYIGGRHVSVFSLFDDNDEKSICFEMECGYLNGSNWIVTEREQP